MSAGSNGEPGVSLDGFAEVTLESRDPEALAAFYRRAFGCSVISREPDRIWLAVGAHARLGLWTPGAKEFGDTGGKQVHFAFRASPGTLDRVVRNLHREEIEVRGPVDHEGGDRSIYVEDPEGNVAEVWDFFNREQGRREGVRALA